MESADFYLSLLAPLSSPSADALRAALDHADPDSMDRAAFALVNLEALKDTHPSDHARLHQALVGELKATLFSNIRLRTSVAATAAMGAVAFPDLDLHDATPKMVEAAIQGNPNAPIYQMFLRAVDYRWDEMMRSATSLAQFGGTLQYTLHVEPLDARAARLVLDGRDAVAFGRYILPGFLRGLAPQMGVQPDIALEALEADHLSFLTRW